MFSFLFGGVFIGSFCFSFNVVSGREFDLRLDFVVDFVVALVVDVVVVVVVDFLIDLVVGAVDFRDKDSVCLPVVFEVGFPFARAGFIVVSWYSVWYSAWYSVWYSARRSPA